MHHDRHAVVVAAAQEVVAELWHGVRIDDATRLTGGASMEVWRLALTGSTSAPAEVILRCALHPLPEALSMAQEAAAMRAAEEHGVPAPRPYATGNNAALGDYLVMDFVGGETSPSTILRAAELETARSRLGAQLGTALAKIHRAPVDGEAAGLPRNTERSLEQMLPRPVHPVPPPGLALGLRWLRDHPVESGPIGLVHGDFRMGNLIVDRDGLAGVLDWEAAHIGDPLMDVGWLFAKVWRFGGGRPVAGVGEREQFLDAYQAVAGWRPSADQVRWWELFSTVRWGIMCGIQARRHLSGDDPSVEFAAIGRRTCEQEFDVLLALGLAEPTPVPDPLSERAWPDSNDLGNPTSLDLLEAIRLYLRQEPIRLDGVPGFHARVAANLTKILQRDLILGGELRADHARRLSALGLADDDALSRAILDGSLDDRWDEVTETVAASVRGQLLIANPRHLGSPA